MPKRVMAEVISITIGFLIVCVLMFVFIPGEVQFKLALLLLPISYWARAMFKRVVFNRQIEQKLVEKEVVKELAQQRIKQERQKMR